MTREGLVKKITQISIPGKEGCCIFKSFTPPPLGKKFFGQIPPFFVGCHSAIFGLVVLVWGPHFRQGNWLETLWYRKIKAGIQYSLADTSHYCKTHLLPFLLRVAIYSHRQILFCSSPPSCIFTLSGNLECVSGERLGTFTKKQKKNLFSPRNF